MIRHVLRSIVVVSVSVLSLAEAAGQQSNSFEKAVRLLERAKTTKNVEDRQKRTDEAQTLLQQFLKQHPKHSQSADAASKLAGILIDKARTDIWKSSTAKMEIDRAALQKRALQQIAEARRHYQVAHDRYKQVFELYPKFIDSVAEPDQFAARKKAENNYMRVQYELAICRYEQAKASENRSSDARILFAVAAADFERVHTKYRSVIVGLYARLWQGKCFEEVDDLRKALGIFNELLGHPGTSPTMQKLQNQARRFRLICLNHEQRKDYHLVGQEAKRWLSENKLQHKTTVGLGIRWELACAQFKLSADPNAKELDRQAYQEQALENARFVQRFSEEHRAAAKAMIDRLTIL